jgi:hypothetical protein
MEMDKEHDNGKPFCSYECAKYLGEKQKWHSVLEKYSEKKISATAVKNECPTRKKRASKDKEKRDLVKSIAKQAINELVEEKLVAAKKLKAECEDASDGFLPITNFSWWKPVPDSCSCCAMPQWIK